jgi:membrane-associated phospholipid phosphatase
VAIAASIISVSFSPDPKSAAGGVHPSSKNSMRTFFIWLACLLVTSIIITVAYLLFDRPIALFAHVWFHRQHPRVVAPLIQISDPLVPLAVTVFLILGLLAFLGRSFSKHEAAAFVCSISIIVTESIKNGLKLIFGRTWPETWIENNPSFIHDGVYGFNFLHGGTAYQSFPSGHMAAACAAVSVLWIWYPRLKWLWVIIGVTVGAALVGTNFHFLSDVISGAFVGISIGWMTMAIWKANAQTGPHHSK